MQFSPESIEVEDDGLVMQTIKDHSVEKYRQLHLYNKILTTGMYRNWNKLVYVDTNCAAGFAKLEGQDKYYMGSPFLALNTPRPFSKYIFCDMNGEYVEALKLRVKRDFPNVDATFIIGDCNEKADEIFSAIPRGTKGNTVLTLCLLDPFDFSINFETVKKLSNCIIDFIFLLAVGLDLKRNFTKYIKQQDSKIDKFLGNSDWKKKISKYDLSDNDKIAYFIVKEFSEQMSTMGYLKESLHKLKKVTLPEINRVLYYLAYFSKKPIGYTYWDQARKYSSDQLKLEL